MKKVFLFIVTLALMCACNSTTSSNDVDSTKVDTSYVDSTFVPDSLNVDTL